MNPQFEGAVKMTKLERLEKIDPQLIHIPCGDGNILVSNTLQGRIMAEIKGTLIHRFEADLAENPDPDNFNNLGGNSLWPAPEGGDFAFNYPPEGDWYVQEGINKLQNTVIEKGEKFLVIGKSFELLNRKGNTMQVTLRRRIECADAPDCGVAALRYKTFETLTLAEAVELDRGVISAWSLEQLPGAAGIVGFGKCANGAEKAINTDFYGDPLKRMSFKGEWFRFDLGGPNRLQIGISSTGAPEFIGSFDPSRGVAVLRWTPARKDGKYINFADNDQLNGAFSAADQFSIFNGSEELDFHELETLAPMTLDAQGRVIGSELESETLILMGENAKIIEILTQVYQVPEEFFC